MTSYKTILVHAGVDSETENRTRAALDLAERFDAVVLGAGALAWDPYIDPALGFVDGETIQALRNQVEEDLKEAEARFQTVFKGDQRRAIWRSVVDYPGRVMSACARCADLIVASPTKAGADDRRVVSSENLVMESGLPVLLLGPGVEKVDASTVVVGWKNTRETRRAVTDALPLLKAADKVIVVAVSENDAVKAAEGELDDVVGRLERHGIAATREATPQINASVAEDLVDIAQSRQADVLVLGAYGRSRLREWAFGGVTRDMLASPGLSILFSR